MIIGDRLKQIRESKKLSQADIERRTGLLRCYLSRVENGHTVPVLETLEKITRAMEIPLYQVFYDGNAPESLAVPKPKAEKRGRNTLKKGLRSAKEIGRLYARINLQKDRQLLMGVARRLARDTHLGRPS
jgi:transcriptional regulator with XRE-family HTH domain